MDDKIELIRVLPTFGGSKHTVVWFTNKSIACSCNPGVGYKTTIRQTPNLREQ